jgi:hypothetical protein
VRSAEANRPIGQNGSERAPTVSRMERTVPGSGSLGDGVCGGTPGRPPRPAPKKHFAHRWRQGDTRGRLPTNDFPHGPMPGERPFPEPHAGAAGERGCGNRRSPLTRMVRVVAQARALCGRLAVIRISRTLVFPSGKAQFYRAQPDYWIVDCLSTGGPAGLRSSKLQVQSSKE